MSCTKISRHRQLNALRMEITTCTRNFFLQNNFFEMDPRAKKLQELGNKQNKIKENEQNSQIIYTSNQ